MTPDGKILFVANADNNNLAVFNVEKPGDSKPLGFIPVGMYPTSVRYDAANKRILVVNGRGTSVNIREGSVRWPVLRQALEAVDYNGWMTIESNGDIPFEERNRRLDLILAGQ